jgi:hypothetical protein
LQQSQSKLYLAQSLKPVVAQRVEVIDRLAALLTRGYGIAQLRSRGTVAQVSVSQKPSIPRGGCGLEALGVVAMKPLAGVRLVQREEHHRPGQPLVGVQPTCELNPLGEDPRLFTQVPRTPRQQAGRKQRLGAHVAGCFGARFELLQGKLPNRLQHHEARLALRAILPLNEMLVDQ